MKRIQIIRLLAASLLLLTLLLTAIACKQSDPPDEGTTPPDTIDTVAPDSTTGEPETDPVPTVSSVSFPASKLPDYAKYATANRIKEVLGSRKTLAVTAGGTKYYANGELKAGGDGIVTVNADGTVTLDAAKLGALAGKTDLTATTPDEVAKALGMGVAVYDHKLVLFYEGAEPLHTYEDLYTYEAMYLYMTDAAETEIVNAFIDLPSRISNDVNNTIFYTAPDLNLGIQTSIYYAQMGQMNSLKTAPALVAGEGMHKDNFTTVRVYNNQNACITQFLAFDATVKGGVQVAAAKVGEEVLIATAPFASHDGKDGDIRIFDSFGMIRMTVNVREVIPGPHYIVTGHFAEGVTDEVLLVASQTTNDKGELRYAIINLSDGSVISEHTLDCSFALNTENAGVNVALSVRNSGEADSVILYFHSVQAVFEGNAQKAEFANAGITLPADAIGVSASNVTGQKYIVSLPVREGQENLSFLTVYDENAAEGSTLDVGFRENRFFSNMAAAYNDDKYVSKGDFCHIRTDLSNNVMNGLGRAPTSAEINAVFDTSTYADYTFSANQQYVDRLATEYLMLEPCFTHRWNVIPATNNLSNYTDVYTGDSSYVAIGKSGEYKNYLEMGNSYHNGTYADGILDLAKLRLYPLRSFLIATAEAFRGVNGNPEHMVGMSPVHEHEINVPGSVGDYNTYMIEGFRGYMLDRYGSVENINSIFGTSFADRTAIDPPRDNGRGNWDKYKGDYFTEWAMYNRYIVSKRIMEAYREALLAGYPPESITAHQIPEGEAVSGFLGDADTRLTPIDVVLTCGTAYGGTRYGALSQRNNIAYNANVIGHSNITLGEYGAMTKDNNATYRQLKMMWDQGVRYVHQMTFGGEFETYEQYAIDKLTEDNLPRPGYTGGTTGSVSIQSGDKQYNIVQIGQGANGESTGLLKSIDTEGKWEGTVYLVPFHTKITASALESLNAPVEGTQNVFTTGKLDTIKNSDQVEITFTAAKVGEARAWVTIEVWHNGCLLNNSVTTYELTETMTPYRYAFSNQLYDDDLEVKVTFHTEAGDGSMENVKLENLRGTLQYENAGFVYYDGGRANRKSMPHVGGVTFDILDRDMLN
ncbi:MAG: family 14 glycosylhydrolase [Clostridia bacterium]|nr:family 14 glycosylhydrolase [Clostridia bacterium]